MEIDWSKAPEGAEYAGTMANGAPEVFYRDIDDLGCYYAHIGNKWSHKKSAPSNQPLIPRPTPSWSGEGLPPVGTVCEVSGCNHDFTKQFNGAKVEVILNDGDLAVFRVLGVLDDLNTQYHALIACKFRPVRTPSQIAADERESAVKEMLEAAGYEKGTAWHRMALAIYDAGYRKP